MIRDIGIDIVHVTRFKEKVNDQKFVQKILGQDEQDLFHNIVDTTRKIEFLASRFSVKEAVFKALCEEGLPLTYHTVQVLYKKNKKPFIQTDFTLKGDLLVSISHDGDYVITQVVYQTESLDV